MHWSWWHDFSSVFRDIAIGLGALAGGIGAIPVINDWRERVNKNRYRSKWQRLISPARYKNKEIDLLKSGDEVYAVDNNAKPQPMWWIRNPSTLHDLGFKGHQAREVNKDELSKYDEGPQINFYVDY